MKTFTPTPSGSLIVGIISNVIALTLVSIVLNTEPKSTLPKLGQISEAIQKIVQTKTITSEDVVTLLGKPSYQRQDSTWTGKWEEASDPTSHSSNVTYEILVLISKVQKDGSYVVVVLTTTTYRTGIKYLYHNLIKVLSGKQSFLFEPYAENEHVQLFLRSPE